ncbi:hypothetical protein SAMN05216370_3120 [Pseudomonas peli]|uniref:Alpha/beta hydrolase n=1 Tax=Pseudomonas peli TaxID=592361 RepID=A0AB37Z9L5_9PSED|nr:alpha/beta hydrolase [Pseudomonas peli]SCW72010.1 hypothetical protein SAMN05216370_3120 [Pseudomonas peli]|tara:strand:- start:1373 stop:2212 length:840 start_codon:yes stop_codon:yes gene_type:complete
MTKMLCILVIGWVQLTGCTSANKYADSIAQAAYLQREQVHTDTFLLTSFARTTRLDQPLMIYIEGDGMAWRSRNRPSSDPTPIQALGLTLAAADTSANVVYLSRPCQFTPIALSPQCSSTYWTGKRFSEEVIAAMNQAVSHYAGRLPGQPVHLIGYSGGGAVAVLIAARRIDIASLRTVAGNLDHVEVNQLHNVSAMPASLNPIDFARMVSDIPQIHFSGARDSVVPTVITQNFVTATAGKCAQIQVIPDMAHDGDWAHVWLRLVTRNPICSNNTRPLT